jgi:hypothetical protein
MLQGLSQITDGSRVKHAKFMMFELGKYSKTGCTVEAPVPCLTLPPPLAVLLLLASEVIVAVLDKS